MLKSVIIFLIAAASAAAQQIGVDFDPAKTEIHWSLVGNVHTTHGTFHLKQGRIAMDIATGAISGDVVADATSGESGNGSRDKRMNQEILESSKFQEFHFTPQKVDGLVSLKSPGTVRVTGIFDIHGTKHSITIPMDVTLTNGKFTGTGKFSIPFVDWGMKDPSNFVFKVDKSVEVEIAAVGKLSLN